MSKIFVLGVSVGGSSIGSIDISDCVGVIGCKSRVFVVVGECTGVGGSGVVVGVGGGGLVRNL